MNEFSLNSLSKPNYDVIDNIQALNDICSEFPHSIFVELGSNKDATKHLLQAREVLESIAIKAVWSTEYINPDYTSTINNPKPDYTNQCGYLILNSDKLSENPNSETNSNNSLNTFTHTITNTNNNIDGKVSLGELVKVTKVIEKRIQQDFFNADKINKLDPQSFISNIIEPKSKQVLIDIDILAYRKPSGEITAIKERYPFKKHEWIGINELVECNKIL